MTTDVGVLSPRDTSGTHTHRASETSGAMIFVSFVEIIWATDDWHRIVLSPRSRPSCWQRFARESFSSHDLYSPAGGQNWKRTENWTWFGYTHAFSNLCVNGYTDEWNIVLQRNTKNSAFFLVSQKFLLMSLFLLCLIHSLTVSFFQQARSRITITHSRCLLYPCKMQRCNFSFHLSWW